MSMQEVPMEKIFIAAVIILSLAAAASAEALHVVHLHILKEGNANKFCQVSKVTSDRRKICG
jgi:hypothetical protein